MQIEKEFFEIVQTSSNRDNFFKLNFGFMMFCLLLHSSLPAKTLVEMNT